MKVMSVLNLRPRKLGSFEEYTISLSRALTQLGNQSILVFKESPPEALLKYYLDAGAILETKPFSPFGFYSARTLDALIRKHRPDILHFHFVNMLSFDVVTATLRRNIKVVFSEHSSDIPKQRSVLKWRLLQAGKRIASTGMVKVIGPSNYVNGRLVQQGVARKRVTTVYNGVNVERFKRNTHSDDVDDVRTKYGIAPNHAIVASISQLIPEKGIGYLIDAAALSIKAGRNVSFIHVGDGPKGKEYREQVRRLGIEDKFVFAGLLNLWEIAAILRQSDIFTLPCTWGEAFSLVVLEALAAEKPLIVTDAGGNVEAVENGRNGLVVPPHDANALSSAILTLVDNPARRREMGEDSAKRSRYFSLERWVNDTISLYAGL
jgi:glycosyltransferase involved in cell wall biosynthesis